jgi:multidrug efflux pump subunit AcrA (membrane-fusion protein)
VKWALATVTPIAVGTAALLWWGLGQDDDVAGTWVQIERRDLVLGCTVEGELEAVDSAELGPPQIREVWDFRIASMAAEGTEVDAGEPVLGFDTTQLVQQLEEKRAERDAAAKELEKRSTDLTIERRNLELQVAEAESRVRRAELKLSVPEEVTARADLEQARIDHRLALLEIEHTTARRAHLEGAHRAELDTLERRRRRAAQRVQELEANIAQMTVRAPRAGTVIYKANWRGEKKKIGDSTWRGEKVIEIPDLDTMQAAGEVDEAHSGRLAVGHPVSLHLEAHPDVTYRGRVARIRRSVQTRSWRDPRKVVRVVVELDQTDHERMRPGMRFRGQVETERLHGVLTVPRDAVRVDPEGAVVVTRSTLGRHRPVRPTLGQHNDESFEVVAGLEAGEWVLIRGHDGGGAG